MGLGSVDSSHARLHGRNTPAGPMNPPLNLRGAHAFLNAVSHCTKNFMLSILRPLSTLRVHPVPLLPRPLTCAALTHSSIPYTSHCLPVEA